MNEVVTKATAQVTPVASDETSGEGRENGEFDVILSTADLDRDGDKLHADEWKTPLPSHITFDSDHGMSVATTVGSGKPFINEQGQLQVRGTFASTSHAQNVRSLVNEGHIRTVSVAFTTRNDTKSGKTSRELLNGAFVAVPANPNALVLSSKSVGESDNMLCADPGFRKDGLRRYPIHAPEHVLMSALDFVDDAGEYPADQRTEIGKRIRAAAESFELTKSVPDADVDTKKDKPDKESYGDVAYADPGYQSDGRSRYPINSAERVRAAWDYIHHRRDGDKYTPSQRAKIEGRIRAAAEKFGVKLDDSSGQKAARTPAENAQNIHDIAVRMGADCDGFAPEHDPGIVDGANKSLTSSPRSTDSSTASTAKAAETADESADSALRDAAVIKANAFANALRAIAL